MWIGHLVRSCLRGGESAEETTKNIDQELDMLLAGTSGILVTSDDANERITQEHPSETRRRI